MLPPLASSKSGLREIRQKAEERLTFVNLAAYSGDMKRLSTQEKKAFHSPYLRFLALQEASGKHHQVLPLTEIARKAESMDWNAPLLPRQAFSLPSGNGFREMSKSISVEDTAKAYLLKMIIDAEWGSYLDPNSYGVSGKGVAHAIGAVTQYMHGYPVWYFKTDIKACFASIDHSHFAADLQKKLTRYMWTKLQPHLMATLEGEQDSWCPETGITTGSPLSALALDIFLKDLGQAVTKGFEAEDVRFFRYIDDILILTPDLEVLEQCLDRLKFWLLEVGLACNEEKTSAGTTAGWFDTGIPLKLLSRDPNYTIPIAKAGFVFLGTRLSQYLNPEGKGFETWVELEIPKEKIAGKRGEDKEIYLQAIAGHIKNIRKKVDGKAYVGSWWNHEYQLPIVPKEPEDFHEVGREKIGTVITRI